MRKLLLILLAICALPFVVCGQAVNAYITPNGTATGACPSGTGTAPNFTVAQAQLSANYGNGTGQIGPGTTVLWCGGMFNTAQNGQLFIEPGNGAVGNPITFTFDTNSVFQSPQFSVNGAIVINGSNVVWNGKNLTIQNTLNGTNGLAGATPGACLAGPCTITAPSQAIVVSGTNSIIENTTITHIYVHTFNQNDCVGGNSTNCNPTAGPAAPQCVSPPTVSCAIGESTTGINVAASATNALITQNLIDNVGVGLSCASGSEISFNTITFSNHSISCATTNGVVFTGIKMHNNDISQAYVWDEPDNQYHHNGIFFFTTGNNAASAISAPLIYYNLIHGQLSTTGHTTSTLFLDNAGGADNAFPNAIIARNVFVLDTTVSGNNVGNSALEAGGCLASGGCVDNTLVANNTVVALGDCWQISPNINDTVTVLNNLCQTSGGAFIPKPVTLPYPPAQIDYNQYPGVPVSNAFAIGTAGCPNPSCNINSYTAWSSSPYFLDVHGGNGTIAAAKLSTTAPYILLSGSSLAGVAKNLTSVYCATYPFVCVGAPTSFGAGSTNNGTTDATSGGWNPGAYPAATSSGSASFVPSTLNFGQINKGASSAPVNNSLFTMTGTGTATFSSEVFSGPNAADFSLSTNGCNFPTGSVSAPGTCSVAIVFTPTAAVGTVETAVFTVSYSGLTGSPATITLTGISGATANLGVTFMGD